jgi:hypothetical protein
MIMTMDQFKDEVSRCLPGVELGQVHAGPHAIETTLDCKEPLVITYYRDEKRWLVRFGMGTANASHMSLTRALTSLAGTLVAEMSYSRARLDRAESRLAVFVQCLPPTREQEV